MNREQLYQATMLADTEWMREIQNAGLGRPGDVRYLPEGKGEPGTALRAAHDKWKHMMDALFPCSTNRCYWAYGGNDEDFVLIRCETPEQAQWARDTLKMSDAKTVGSITSHRRSDADMCQAMAHLGRLVVTIR